MLISKKLAGGVATTALLLAMASAVHAQETTGSIRGQVTDEAGAPVSGATVVITHTPTGTRQTTLTGADGFYTARGLRVGGPYGIAVTSPQGEETAEIASIGVGDPAQVDVAILGAATVEAVTVVGQRFANDFGAGSASNFGAGAIQSLPSISRDLKDVARLDPFAVVNDPDNQDALSFGGVNTRLNQLTVDGMRQNDEFGLNGNGYPTQRSPISLDAVQALNVSAAPFSVINNGFIGGSINAVTRSGTNSFHGSAFYEKSDDSMIGSEYFGFDNRTRINGVDNPSYGYRNTIPYSKVFDEKTWGVTLGGPILRDRLFFFLSYEKFESTFSLDEGPTDAGFSTEVPRITAAAIETFRAATQARYGYDTGSYVTVAPPVEDEKYLAKLDWNITEDHRLALVFQETRGSSFNGSVTTAFPNGDSLSQPRVGLQSTQWTKDERLTTYSAQLNSQWTPNLSTELRLGYKETETLSLPVGGLTVGQVTVNVADLPGVLAGAGTPQIQFGADNFRHDNYLYSENTNFELIARYNLNTHDILAGFRSEQLSFLNVFVERSLGGWNFNSYADFLAGNASALVIRGAVDPNGGTVPAKFGTAREGAVEFGYAINSAYIEDSWSLNDDLRVIFGARYDWFTSDDQPVLNANFVSRQGFANTANIDGRSLLLPRFGFNYSPGDWTVSGGIGRFSTVGTNVQIGNPFGNDGARITQSVCPANSLRGITNLAVAPAGCTFTPGNGNVVALDPDFEIPSAWKYNLTVGRDFELPIIQDFRLQADFIITDQENSLYYTDLRATRIGTAPDGRPVYGRSTNGTIGPNLFDLLLTNREEGGRSMAAAFTASKSWNDGWLDGLDLRASYTYTEAEDANPLTSSQPDSSYVRFASADHNNPELATSDYEIRHRASLNAHWARKFFGDNETSVNVFAQRRSGLPFSYVFHNSRGANNIDNDFGNVVPQSYSGALGTSNQLFYVPQTDSSGVVTATSDPRVVYSGINLDQFNAFLRNTGLIEYAGSIAPRNAFRTRTLNTVDVRLSQELPVPFVPKGKIKAYWDIENFGNLLNKEWGVLEQYPFYRGVGTVQVQCGAGAAGACAAPGAVYTYSQLQTPNLLRTAATVGQPADLGGEARRPLAILPASVWQMKVGVRFEF